MPYLLDLADACRKSNLPVVEEGGWKLRGHGPMVGVRSITCHHTAGPATGDSPSLRVVRDGRPGLLGPLSQLFLTRSGTVHVVSAGLSYHAGVVFEPLTQGNAWSIGIEAEATGVSSWPKVQYDAYVRLCRALINHYGLSVSRVLGHKEVCSPRGRKIDPNFDMAAFRAAVANVPEDDMTPEEHNMLVAVHSETTRRLVNRRGPDGVELVGGGDETLFGYAANADGMGFRLEDEVASLKEAVAAIEVGGIDYDLLADKVADRLAARMAD